MSDCVTHHHACDCREAEFAAWREETKWFGQLNSALAEAHEAAVLERNELRERVATLEGERDEAVRLLADEHATHHPYCCMDGDDLCHIGQFRALLDAFHDQEPWRNNDCPHGYGFDDCCHEPSACRDDQEQPVE